MAAAVALTAVANATNDYYDRDLDRLAHPERPLPSGRLDARAALRLAAVAAVVALGASAAATPSLGVATALVLALMFVYNSRLKASGAAGNALVAILASLPFLYGAWATGRPLAALPLVALAVPVHFAREVAKDLDDAKADAPTRRTLPVLLGRRRTLGVIAGALVAGGLAAVPLARLRPAFALLLAPSAMCCVVAARRAAAGRAGAPTLLKVAMVTAMAALLLAGRP